MSTSSEAAIERTRQMVAETQEIIARLKDKDAHRRNFEAPQHLDETLRDAPKPKSEDERGVR